MLPQTLKGLANHVVIFLGSVGGGIYFHPYHSGVCRRSQTTPPKVLGKCLVLDQARKSYPLWKMLFAKCQEPFFVL